MNSILKRQSLALILFLCLAIGFLTNCSSEKPIERPREPWVFRSVLDEQARMVTIALDDNLWVAYNTQTATMYKAWKGGANFDGAVYTTVHGPQPTSLGYAYYQNANSDIWQIVKGQEASEAKVRYKGHVLDNGKVTLNFNLLTPDGGVIEISEQPEFVKRGNQNGLERIFRVTNTTDYQPRLLTTITSLQVNDDFATQGEFQSLKEQEVEYPNGKVFNIFGHLTLSDVGENSIKIFYHPGFDKLGDLYVEEEETTSLPLGAQLIDRSDCRSCHNEKVKTVGPAYITVARKYNDSEETQSLLANKIIKGGNGVWGEALMTAHPDLDEESAKEMIRYILSLDDEDEGGTQAKYTLGEKSIPLKLTEKYEGEGQGLLVSAYVNSSKLSIEETLLTDPVKNGVAERLHVLSERDFDDFTENFVLKVSGQVDIPADGSYDFRLVSDDDSFLYLDGQLVIDNGGFHGAEAVDGEMYLKAGKHDLEIQFLQGGGGATLSLQWFDRQTEKFVLLGPKSLSHTTENIIPTKPYVPASQLTKSIPGDAKPLEEVHPSFDLFQARPEDFQPRVGGIDFFSDGAMVVCTWDSLGPVYLIEGWQTGDPAQMTSKLIATGLAEPLGLKIVDDELFVLQKQELTQLIDKDGDRIIDEYKTISDQWKVSANFHEFAFGLVYQEGYFYATLATAILPGGASANPQIPDRGKVVKINKATGATSFVAHGLRTPNGIGEGLGSKIFVADNQGDWLPASKIVHIREGEWYGSRSVDFEGTASLKEALPVVWLPQDEIGNSPSTPVGIEAGPYKGQLIHGEVTHGGIKRVFAEEVNGQLQGAVFRFTQGLEAGINRIAWAPDGSLIVGGVGSTGNWGHTGKYWYGLQRLVYNEESAFEMLKVSARSDGFDIEFSEPIKEGQQINSEDFLIQLWRYEPTAEYGGPKLDLASLKIEDLSISEDRKNVALKIKGLKEEHVVYFRITRPFQSELDHSLWTTEAWYTLNSIPVDTPIQKYANSTNHNSLTEGELSQGWKLLFDGKTTEGFRNFKKKTLGSKWEVDKGTLHYAGKNKNESDFQSTQGGDIIITDKEYEDYELYLEWKIAPGGNSGVIFNIIESDKYDYVWQTGPEMQILDNAVHPDGQIIKHKAGDLYDLIECGVISVNTVDGWNRARIVMKGGKLEQWLNGYKVVTTEMWTSDWDKMVAGSKFKEMPDFGTGRKGHIALQDHGDKVWFRNIKIREL